MVFRSDGVCWIEEERAFQEHPGEGVEGRIARRRLLGSRGCALLADRYQAVDLIALSTIDLLKRRVDEALAWLGVAGVVSKAVEAAGGNSGKVAQTRLDAQDPGGVDCCGPICWPGRNPLKPT